VSGGGQKGYWLVKTAANNISFSISNSGADEFTATSTGTVTTGQWYFCVGRFDPSTTVDVFLDGVKDTNAVGIPAAVFNTNNAFRIGTQDATLLLLDGKVSNCFLCASQLSDSIITALWEQSRVMYGKEG